MKQLFHLLISVLMLQFALVSCDSHKSNDDNTTKYPLSTVSDDNDTEINDTEEESSSGSNLTEEDRRMLDQLNNLGKNLGGGAYYPSNSSYDNNYDMGDNDYSSEPCQVCRMTGRCQVCDGSGTVMVKEFGIDGMQPQACQACNGTGRCEGCNGTGYLQ